MAKGKTATGLLICSQPYKRARYYDATNGEFLSPDPLEYVDGFSRLNGWFCVGDVDPFGLDRRLGPENHHWLDNRVKNAFQKKCKFVLDLLGLNWGKFRDFFTTQFQPGWGKNSVHTYIHYWDPKGHWDKRVNDAISNAGNCCDAILALKEMIEREIKLAYPELLNSPFKTLPLHHYHDEFTLTQDFLDGVIWCACNPECCRIRPPEIPVPQKRPVPIRSPRLAPRVIPTDFVDPNVDPRFVPIPPPIRPFVPETIPKLPVRPRIGPRPVFVFPLFPVLPVFPWEYDDQFWGTSGTLS